MPLKPGPVRSIVALCVTALLCAQVLGLHYHRHLELDDSHGHGTALHFEDAGVHAHEQADEHRHEPGAATHPHIDIETRAVDDGLTKLFLDVLLVLLPVVLLALAPRRRGTVPQPGTLLGHDRPPRYAVCPPAQAPPLNSVFA